MEIVGLLSEGGKFYVVKRPKKSSLDQHIEISKKEYDACLKSFSKATLVKAPSVKSHGTSFIGLS